MVYELKTLKFVIVIVWDFLELKSKNLRGIQFFTQNNSTKVRNQNIELKCRVSFANGVEHRK